jgi:hypothetical protein
LKLLLYVYNANQRRPGCGKFLPQDYNLKNFYRVSLDVTHKISKHLALRFQERILKILLDVYNEKSKTPGDGQILTPGL